MLSYRLLEGDKLFLFFGTNFIAISFIIQKIQTNVTKLLIPDHCATQSP